MGTQKLLILVVTFTATLAACGNKNESAGVVVSPGTAPASTPSVPVSAPSVSTASPFAISMYTTYDQTSFNNPLTFAETGTTSCVATASQPVVTCTVTVPEGRLYYSSLSFAFSWLPSSCKLLQFKPYSYLASQSASYLAPGATATTDCTQSPTPLACYGGAAKYFVPGYIMGVINGLIYLPDETSLTTPNAKTLALPSGASSLAGSNRQSVNDLPSAKIGNNYSAAQLGGAGDGYIANTYGDYTFTCRDDWYDPLTYSITVYVRDQDSAPTNPAVDNFYTWKEAP